MKAPHVINGSADPNAFIHLANSVSINIASPCELGQLLCSLLQLSGSVPSVAEDVPDHIRHIARNLLLQPSYINAAKSYINPGEEHEDGTKPIPIWVHDTDLRASRIRSIVSGYDVLGASLSV